MEKAKENAALSGKRSSGVAPCQGQKNREAVNGDSLLRMTATGKIEETNLDLLREYRMNVFAQKSTSSLLIRQPFLRRFLVCLEAERAVRKERGEEKRFKLAGLPRGAYGL